MLSFKKFYDKYGDYTIYLVNEQEIRNMSKSLQEFSNYGIHADFPKQIHKNEIWLSEQVDNNERFFLIAAALAQIKYELQGMSADKAYDKALALDKALRHKDIHSKHIDIPTNNKVPEEIYLDKYGSIKDINIWIVDGELVRDFFKTDFVEAGHDYVYHWIPFKEIWVDKEVKPEERKLIILHELTERTLMKDKKISYDKAHEKASKVEWRFRKLKF